MLGGINVLNNFVKCQTQGGAVLGIICSLI
jgi:hypothetical protein